MSGRRAFGCGFVGGVDVLVNLCDGGLLCVGGGHVMRHVTAPIRTEEYISGFCLQ